MAFSDQPGAINFYPRPPRGGRLKSARSFLRLLIFLSTPSARRATGELLNSAGRHVISIHALREEGDRTAANNARHADISIHALREEGDLASSVMEYFRVDFYPRPPRGGRLLSQGRFLAEESISIHALREEGDEAIRSRTLGKGISIHALREEGDESTKKPIR